MVTAEARKRNCNDHGWVDMVAKFSSDEGKTWGAMKIIRSESSDSKEVTIGNISPVVL